MALLSLTINTPQITVLIGRTAQQEQPLLHLSSLPSHHRHQIFPMELPITSESAQLTVQALVIHRQQLLQHLLPL